MSSLNALANKVIFRQKFEQKRSIDFFKTITKAAVLAHSYLELRHFGQI